MSLTLEKALSCSRPHKTINTKNWQLVFGVSLRAATSNLTSAPNPLSNSSVLHDGRKHKTVVFSQSNALRE